MLSGRLRVVSSACRQAGPEDGGVADRGALEVAVHLEDLQAGVVHVLGNRVVFGRGHVVARGPGDAVVLAPDGVEVGLARDVVAVDPDGPEAGIECLMVNVSGPTTISLTTKRKILWRSFTCRV